MIERVWRSYSDHARGPSSGACSSLGAVLLTAYLGGAVSTHVIHRGTAFETGFAVAFGVLVWVGLALREPGLVRWIFLRQGS